MSEAVTPKAEPKGVIAIFTAPDGDVIATAADFNRSGMGGCKLWEAQTYRAQDTVKWKAVQAYCSPAVSDALSKYLLEQIATAMIGKGHKITVRAIGWGDEVEAEMRERWR